MCGIAGILQFKDPTVDPAVIQRMTDQVAHRGPDADGFYTDEHIALGHRRLSIIDLNEGANQPMKDYSGRYVIVFNGEIYNYQELKNKLPLYPFKTQSDSEVILAYYNTYGVNCLDYFNGMFAFAIWDTKEKRMFVARDRVGEKPFYYHLTDEHFMFASEARSLLASGKFERQLEENYLAEFLVYQAAMDHHTMVKGVYRLRAGHYALIEKGIFTEKKYWGYEHIQICKDDPIRIKDKVRELFLQAVQSRMVSDVPVGAFLSGGIDSSLIVACMAELSSQPVNTFSISFEEKQFDESDYAQRIADKYATHHHRIVISPEEFLGSMEDIFRAMDTPSGDGPNTYLVSKYTRQQNIKVALSGLGGDELFAGYNKFMMYTRLMNNKWVLSVPPFIRHAIADAALSIVKDSRINKLGHILDLKKWNLATIYPLLRRAYSQEEISAIVRKPMSTDHVEENLSLIDQETHQMESLSKCTIGEMETYTRDVLLRDTDQMSMAHGLEVRVPFFDHRLIEYVLSLPDNVKYPHTPKQLLVESMSPRLPNEIVMRPKMGFTLPWEKWLRYELASMVDNKINYLASRPEFNSNGIQHKWEQFKKGNSRIQWSRIWKLVVLSDWLERNKL